MSGGTRVMRQRSRRRAAVLLSVLLGPLVLSICEAATVGAVATGPTRVVAGSVLVTNLNTNSVTVIDPKSHKVVQIGGGASALNGPLGIAIAPNAATAYVTNSLGDTVTPISLLTNPPSFQPSIRVGSGPAAIAITPNGAMAYVTNFNANSVTPIDLTTSPPTPLRSINVGFGPWSVAVSPNGHYVCVSDSESNSVSVIDVATSSVTNVQLANRPQALVVNPNGSSVYVANGNAVTSIDLAVSPARASGSIVVNGGPVGIAISPNGSVAYTANTDNTVTPIDLTTNPPSARGSVQVGTLTQPDGIAISPNGATAYAANASNNVTPINLTTNPVSPDAPIGVGTASFGIAVVPDQAPIARLVVKPALAGAATVFNASASKAPNGTIARYTWNFGDGTSQVTTSPKFQV